MNKYIAVMLSLILFTILTADPRPGEVFREFRFPTTFSECDPGATAGFCPDKPKMVVKNVVIFDLADATKAEVSVEYWGGHIGTSDQKFRANNNAWILIPQPSGTPSSAYCFYRTVFGRPAASIPLSHLKEGPNQFQFTCGPQICNSFNWGFYWIYAFTVRVYYDPTKKDQIEATITSPANNTTVGDVIRVSAGITGTMPAKKIEFVGYYEDFDWDGNGIYREYQYQYQKTFIKGNIGTVAYAPWQVTWDNSWVPEQSTPIRIAAFVTYSTNLVYMTPAVNVTLQRSGRLVRMYRASNVPKAFGVRTGATKSCNISVGNSLSGATKAQLVLSSWSAAPEDAKSYYIKLNSYTISTDFGVLHNWSQDIFDIPLNQIKEASNTFTIHAQTSGHALEVNWPGPALKVQWGLSVGVNDKTRLLPETGAFDFSVSPNPVRPGQSMVLKTNSQGHWVPVAVYNMQGELVRNLEHQMVWDGKDMNNNKTKPGIYLVRAGAGDQVVQQRVLITP